MKLQYIFEQLTGGELTQISMGGQEQGKITEANYRIVMNHINLGLTDLFNRFLLKEGRHTLVLDPLERTYFLDLADLAKVEAIKSSSGYEFVLNDSVDEFSILTPSMNVLVVPEAILLQSSDLPDVLKTSTLEILYRATHPKLDTSEDADIEPEYIDVALPEQYLLPLLYFVASRVYGPVGQGAEASLGTFYAQKYDIACKALEKNSVALDKGIQNSKFRERGFV